MVIELKWECKVFDGLLQYLLLLAELVGFEFVYSQPEALSDKNIQSPILNLLLQLWATTDFGMTWSRTQEFVKAYFWVAEDDGEEYLLVQRQEPTTSSVIAIKSLLPDQTSSLSLVIRDIVDCWVKGEFIFVTRKDPKVRINYLAKNIKTFDV